MSVTLTDLELEAIQDRIAEARTGSDVPTVLILDAVVPTIERIIERRLTAARQWVGGRDS